MRYIHVNARWWWNFIKLLIYLHLFHLIRYFLESFLFWITRWFFLANRFSDFFWIVFIVFIFFIIIITKIIILFLYWIHLLNIHFKLISKIYVWIRSILNSKQSKSNQIYLKVIKILLNTFLFQGILAIILLSFLSSMQVPKYYRFLYNLSISHYTHEFQVYNRIENHLSARLHTLTKAQSNSKILFWALSNK